METKRFKIVNAESNIDWVGKKVKGAHNGTISIKEGEIVLKDGKLAGGRFVVDINSIKILDIMDPVANAQFVGHLASDDFFSTDKFPEAIFEIVSVSGLFVVGDLTIKGISRPADLNVSVDVNGDLLTATGKLMIDRTEYGMKFRSGNFIKDLGDNLIYNDFELNVYITAKTA
jgi:polyisoprenoid-binding protein YceI